MSGCTLQRIRSAIDEIQYLNRWRVTVPTWPVAAQPDNPDTFLMLVTNVTKPTIEDQKTEVKVCGLTLNFNGRIERSGDIDLTFVENVGNDVKNYWRQYMSARQVAESSANISSNASRTADILFPSILLEQLDTDDESVLDTIELVNVIATLTNLGGDFGQDAEASAPEINLAFDSWV